MAKTITATIEKTTRLRNTRNGNPRWEVEVLTSTPGYPGRTTFLLAADCSLGGRIENSEFRDVPHVYELDRYGNIARLVGVADFVS